MTLRVAIYARVSTLHQAQAQTIEQQLTRLQVYAHDHGWLVLQRDLVRNYRAAAAGASGVRSRLDSSGLGCTG